MAFNLENIRNLNEVKFYTQASNADKPTQLSKGKWFTTKGWDYNFNVKTDTVFGGGTQLIGSPLLSSLFGYVIGGATVLDIARKYAYAGSEPIQVNLPCYLILKEDPNDDIIKPLNELLRLILPVRQESASAKLTSEQVTNKIHDWAASTFDSKGTGAVWDLINKAVNAIFEYTGDVYTLSVPEAFRKGGNKLKVKWGGHLLDDVFIKRIHVKTNTFIYGVSRTDETGNSETIPIPDCAFVDIDIETTRVISLNSKNMNYFDEIRL